MNQLTSLIVKNAPEVDFRIHGQEGPISRRLRSIITSCAQGDPVIDNPWNIFRCILLGDTCDGDLGCHPGARVESIPGEPHHLKMIDRTKARTHEGSAHGYTLRVPYTSRFLVHNADSVDVEGMG